MATSPDSAIRKFPLTSSLVLALSLHASACSESAGQSSQANGGAAGVDLSRPGGQTAVESQGPLSGSSASNTVLEQNEGAAPEQDGSTSVGTVCTNGADDDGDGLVDGFDPECTGAADNDESSFATGIPGDNRDPKWQDCFFDGNSGAGDDHCRYATGCLTGELSETDPDCRVTQTCIDFCRRLTPNGCDCFGCCRVELETGSTIAVTLSPTCSLSNATDPEACPRCEPSTQCSNECGECELCPGREEADLPETCQPSEPQQPPAAPEETPTAPDEPPPSYTCDEGLQVCGTALPACADGDYCSMGCCLPMIR